MRLKLCKNLRTASLSPKSTGLKKSVLLYLQNTTLYIVQVIYFYWFTIHSTLPHTIGYYDMNDHELLETVLFAKKKYFWAAIWKIA